MVLQHLAARPGHAVMAPPAHLLCCLFVAVVADHPAAGSAHLP